MIYVGIDDTDVEGSRGTNQLARSLVAELATDFRCLRIIRHQLLEDPRVPCTTKNGSASILLESSGRVSIEKLKTRLRARLLEWFVDGSDPGLCVAPRVSTAVVEFGHRCKRELVTQEEAMHVARRNDVDLEGLGGTNGGVIGALAAVGLAASDDDGRIVQLAQWPDDVAGVHAVDFLRKRGLAVRLHETGDAVETGEVDVGKRLRPNRSRGEDVLFVQLVSASEPHMMKALKLP